MRNRRKKAELVEKGCAYGILLYAEGDPVGWCQYGPRKELPRTGNSQNYRRLGLEDGTDSMWIITCFVLDKQHRGRGVTTVGLRAALEAIKKKGGGLVETYPVNKTDQGSNYLYCRTMSMFEKAGFKKVAPSGTGRTVTVVMSRTI